MEIFNWNKTIKFDKPLKSHKSIMDIFCETIFINSL